MESFRLRQNAALLVANRPICLSPVLTNIPFMILVIWALALKIVAACKTATSNKISCTFLIFIFLGIGF